MSNLPYLTETEISIDVDTSVYHPINCISLSITLIVRAGWSVIYNINTLYFLCIIICRTHVNTMFKYQYTVGMLTKQYHALLVRRNLYGVITLFVNSLIRAGVSRLKKTLMFQIPNADNVMSDLALVVCRLYETPTWK